MRQHAGKEKGGAKALRAKGPLELAYQVKIGSRPLALRAEYRLKRLSKADKEGIVAQQPRARKIRNLLHLVSRK